LLTRSARASHANFDAVQLSENASALVLNGLPSRSRFHGRPAASMPLRDRRAPSAGHEHRAHAVAAPRYKIGLRVNEERIADVVPGERDFFAPRHRRHFRAVMRYFTFCSIGETAAAVPACWAPSRQP